MSKNTIRDTRHETRGTIGSSLCLFASRVSRPASWWIAPVVALAWFSGCETTPHAPNFDATWPEMMEPASTTSGAIFQQGHEVSLFENSVARRVGDTVTIQLAEATNASKSS